MLFKSDTSCILLKCWRIFTQLYFFLMTQYREVDPAEVRRWKPEAQRGGRHKKGGKDVREARMWGRQWREKETSPLVTLLGHFLGLPWSPGLALFNLCSYRELRTYDEGDSGPLSSSPCSFLLLIPGMLHTSPGVHPVFPHPHIFSKTLLTSCITLASEH